MASDHLLCCTVPNYCAMHSCRARLTCLAVCSPSCVQEEAKGKSLAQLISEGKRCTTQQVSPWASVSQL